MLTIRSDKISNSMQHNIYYYYITILHIICITTREQFSYRHACTSEHYKNDIIIGSICYDQRESFGFSLLSHVWSPLYRLFVDRCFNDPISGVDMDALLPQWKDQLTTASQT